MPLLLFDGTWYLVSTCDSKKHAMACGCKPGAGSEKSEPAIRKQVSGDKANGALPQ